MNSRLGILWVRISIFCVAAFAAMWLPAGAQNPPVWTVCEQKWHEAGKPADYQGFITGCVRSNQTEALRKADLKTQADESQQVAIQTGCRMDVCSWLRPKAKTSVQTGWRGVLFRILADYGVSDHPEGSYDKRTPIRWEKQAEGYVFCSKVMPAIINKDGEGWLATILAPGNPDAGPGMLRESYLEYFLICHDLNFSRTVVLDKDVGSLGYPAGLVEHAGDQMRLALPTDILDDYRSITFQDFKLDGKELAAHRTRVRLQGFYKKFDNLDTLQPSALAVAAAREYGGDSGIPLLTDDATRAIRKIFLECGDNPTRPLGCPITLSGHVDMCTAGNLFASKSVPCLAVEDGY